MTLHSKVQSILHSKVQPIQPNLHEKAQLIILYGKVQPILHGQVQLIILHGKGLRREVRGSTRSTSASGEAVTSDPSSSGVCDDDETTL
jgi:hypothetical protein